MGRAGAGESRGCTSRLWPTIIAVCIGVRTKTGARSTHVMSKRFCSTHPGMGAALRHILRKLCQVLAAKSFFPPDTFEKFTNMCALWGQFALRMKCKWVLGGWVR